MSFAETTFQRADKFARLRDRLCELGSVAVAFSSGVDSTLLLALAHEVLGDKAVAVTARPNWVPSRDVTDASDFCVDRGIDQVWLDVTADQIEGFVDNTPDRCYRCKKALFSGMQAVAAERGLACVVEGSNTDDVGDYRPGMRALAELGIVSPLREAGLSKEDVRALAHELGLEAWNKPSAACLASRVAYGEPLDADKLARIDRAENYLHDLGFSQVRVRVHGVSGQAARIEVPAEDVARVVADGLRGKVVEGLRDAGFSYVSLDLEGFRSGSGNEVLQVGGSQDAGGAEAS